VPAWAEQELKTMGGLTRREITLAILVGHLPRTMP